MSEDKTLNTSELKEKFELEQKIEKTRVSKMALRRKSIKNLYSDTGGTRTYVRKSTSSAASIFTSDNLTSILNTAGSSSFNWDRAKQLTDYAYGVNENYASIIDFLSNMYLWRYFYMPVKIKENAKGDYKEVYDLMTSIVDGANIEVIFPIILTSLYKDGIVYIYTDKDTPSQSVITYILDSSYCEPVMMSQYATGIYQFDATYFDNLGLNDNNREEVLKLFPKELSQAYDAYKKDRSLRYHLIDGRYGTFLRLSELNFPRKLSVIKSIFDYDTYRANEVERNGAQLDKIISHKIPAYEDQLLFEIDEVHDLHNSMKAQLASNTRTRLLTTFGDLEVHHLGENDKIQNEVLEKAHNAIYSSAGLNMNVFNGDSDKSLAMSLAKDAAITWKYIQQLVSFYNLTLNHLYNFKGYQVELTMLPITHYNLSESLKDYKSNAEYGVGRLEFIVASGTKQKHIAPKAELEKFLKLEEILQPLQSSHTQSGNDIKNDSDKKEDPDESEVEVNKPEENEDTE